MFGNKSEPIGSFSIIFMWYFQQLLPVGDIPIYEESVDSLIFLLHWKCYKIKT